ncbi:MAG: cytochrome c3 family protein [Pyrinomonadaceae bacterium]
MSQARAQDELADGPRPARGRRFVSLAIISAAVLSFTLMLALGSRASAPLSTPGAATSTAQGGGDYSRFQHANPQHARLPCLLCHRREDNSPRPVRSAGHTPCSGCHTQQFADASSPICTICHENPSSGAVKPFPALSSFNVTFDHARHIRGAARPAANCAACHRPARRGVALSIPSGTAAHTTCFQCHGPGAQSAGRDISSCGTCHKVSRYARTQEWARAFGVNFSHAAHTSRGLSCAACHSVRAGAAQGRQVASPVPLHHHAPARANSCMTCHNNTRAFGGDDFSDCTRCHRGNAWRF